MERDDWREKAFKKQNDWIEDRKQNEAKRIGDETE